VYVRGTWRGECESKNFVAFSPVFHVDDKPKPPARVICRPDANPNMGGFTNSPAFGSKLTLRVNDSPKDFLLQAPVVGADGWPVRAHVDKVRIENFSQPRPQKTWRLSKMMDKSWR